jgi:hypothetical protein
MVDVISSPLLRSLLPSNSKTTMNQVPGKTDFTRFHTQDLSVFIVFTQGWINHFSSRANEFEG